MNWLFRKENWWKVFVLIFSVSISVVGYIGYKTYEYAPPIADFTGPEGDVIIEAAAITRGQQVFLKHGLMDYGSFLGDGGMRGPDYSAEALNLTAKFMQIEIEQKLSGAIADPELRAAAALAQTQRELKENRSDEAAKRIGLSAAQVAAFQKLRAHYTSFFSQKPETGPVGVRGSIPDPQEVADLSAFFFWGGWLCAARRPGFDYSYTHNWPYDPLAGNLPTPGIMLWSVIGALVLVLSLGVILYYYGKMDRKGFVEGSDRDLPPLATEAMVDASQPTATQRACYKFFALAAALFGLQVFCGLWTIADFLGLPIGNWLPVAASRALHTQISVLWIAVCWFASTIWVLPMICRPEPVNQVRWINGFFGLLVVVGLGTAIGVPLGVHGVFGDLWRWFGLQGWEFVQMGRVYQYLLFAGFVLWLAIVVRGLMPVLRKCQTWSLPNWMVYSIAGIIFMFAAGFVAGPETNFVIADFWRWCTIHMWVEAFFELFVTIIVAYFMYVMGFVSHMAAARVVYVGAVLFLGSGLIGISHNFYWNAKSIETLALGGVLSTLQIVPLILLTIESWRFRHMPGSAVQKLRGQGDKDASFGLPEAFLFLIGVNFWNFFGAGVLGFGINLPIVNYYQHGTYLTVNHGHAALFGVYGNLAIAAMLFCGRWMVQKSAWKPSLLRGAFWSLNLGLLLMVFLDLFPAGIHQLVAVFEQGYAHARSQAYVESESFQLFTWLRGVGVAVFVLGGVIPIVGFVIGALRSLKPAASAEAAAVAPATALAGL